MISYLQFSSRIGQACAFIAASLISPILAHAGIDNGKGNGGENNGNPSITIRLKPFRTQDQESHCWQLLLGRSFFSP